MTISSSSHREASMNIPWTRTPSSGEGNWKILGSLGVSEGGGINSLSHCLCPASSTSTSKNSSFYPCILERSALKIWEVGHPDPQFSTEFDAVHALVECRIGNAPGKPSYGDFRLSDIMSNGFPFPLEKQREVRAGITMYSHQGSWKIWMPF